MSRVWEYTTPTPKKDKQKTQHHTIRAFLKNIDALRRFSTRSFGANGCPFLFRPDVVYDAGFLPQYDAIDLLCAAPAHQALLHIPSDPIGISLQGIAEAATTASHPFKDVAFPKK